MLFLHYPRCSTSVRAKHWLRDNNIDYTERNHTVDIPTPEELAKWHKISGLDSKRFFNTHGLQYRSRGLKHIIPSMTDEERFELLSTDGMLIKRPMLITDEWVLVGFNEDQWREKLLS